MKIGLIAGALLRYHKAIAVEPGRKSIGKILFKDVKEFHLRKSKLNVPDPPGRPLIMGFTSRTVHLSWAPSLDTHNSPVKYYIIEMR
ncbi:hypothetical protein J437_LFUL006039 [Ladona fulva]|uniref:Fibronectin type-III domain-containing protein n=1 Tax=Ladona fulva TaxID=123851 RepID=A0A8K0K0B7_LADFU|nr:hypothetical protein J437_LFUL006039 [Ladona fulva]